MSGGAEEGCPRRGAPKGLPKSELGSAAGPGNLR